MFIRERLKAFRTVTLYYCDESPPIYSPCFYGLCSCHYFAVQLGSGRCGCPVRGNGFYGYPYLGICGKLSGLFAQLRTRLPVSWKIPDQAPELAIRPKITDMGSQIWNVEHAAFLGPANRRPVNYSSGPLQTTTALFCDDRFCAANWPVCGHNLDLQLNVTDTTNLRLAH